MSRHRMITVLHVERPGQVVPGHQAIPTWRYCWQVGITPQLRDSSPWIGPAALEPLLIEAVRIVSLLGGDIVPSAPNNGTGQSS